MKKECTWNDFIKDPLNINPSTLAYWIKVLINNNFIESRGKSTKFYRITNKGLKKLTLELKKFNNQITT